ncbi:hypothetical protein HHL17_14400 [Chitinophaga sp. G-6-1-13]|uniref:DUF3137 domain-containing protein n=1 Tax=Chitinophaga fulva TaxID=2728842 RepID=A0A848GIH3_9BACT|nr:hypothetical protein [Chitinophaga fulva]NML38395.1 hypothetical protein [Chitinophaga fulva]
MKNPPTWQFNIADQKRGIWGFVATITAFLGIMVPGLAFNLSVGLIITIVLVVILTLLILTVRWMWRKETLTLYHDHIESALYGAIYFTDVRKISRPWGAMSPAIKLRLKDRRVSWSMVRSSRALIQNTPEEVMVFQDFLHQLEAAMNKQTPKPAKPEVNADSANAHMTPTAQLSQINRSGNDTTSLVVGATLIVVVLLGVATCVTRSRKPDFKRMKAASKERFYRSKQKVDELVAQRLEKEGGAFLYTNDHAATIKLFPYINTDNPLNIDLFQYIEANKDMDAILANPDSAQLDIYVISGDSAVRRMKPDTSARQFFFRAYDPKQRIRPSNVLPNDTAGQENYPVFDVSWRVSLLDTTNLLYAMDRSIPGMHIMLAQVRLRPTFYLYMTGKVKQGMNEPAFREAVITLNKLLHRSNVDTSTFVISRI